MIDGVLKSARQVFLMGTDSTSFSAAHWLAFSVAVAEVDTAGSLDANKSAIFVSRLSS